MTDQESSAPTEDTGDVPEPGLHPLPPRLGRYHLTRLIAAGGMGAVYEARQEHPRRTVAVKVLRRGVSSPESLRRFEQEAQILARLQHPGIAQVHEAAVHENADVPGETVPYIVMEYIAGARPITEYVQAKKLDIDGRLTLFLDVCDAIACGHQHGVIHRDLKPGNVLVDSGGRVKVIDFGVARTADSDLAATMLQTKAGQLIGTVPYMSPEQLEGDPLAVDLRSDVYSLGVLLYEMLSGRLPYDIADTPMVEINRIIRETPPTPPSSVDTRLRGDVNTILLTALQKDPDRRYDSVHAMQSDIERYLRGEPIVARRDSAWYVGRTLARRSIARHPALSVFGAGAAAALLAWYAGVPVIHQWTPIATRTELAMTQWMAPPTPLSQLDRVRLVVLETDVADVIGMAEREGLEGIDPAGHGRSLRRLHGRLMEKLARAGPAVVAWDMEFPGAPNPRDQPFTDDFIAGAGALADAGVPVVIGLNTWDAQEIGVGVVNPDIAKSVQKGCLGANMPDDGPWILNSVAAKEPNEPMPSMALAAASWAEFPHDDGIEYQIDEPTAVVTARPYMNDATLPSGRRFDERELRLTMSSVSEWDQANDLGLDRGDFVGRFVLDMPADEVFDAATIPYEQVMAATDAERREWFGERAVMVWASWSGNDMGAYHDGRSLHYYQGQAVGLDQLMAGVALLYARPWHTALMMPVAAALGIVAAVAAQGRWRRRVLLLLLFAAALVGASLLACQIFHYVTVPIVPVIAMIAAAELSAEARRIRAEKHY